MQKSDITIRREPCGIENGYNQFVYKTLSFNVKEMITDCCGLFSFEHFHGFPPFDAMMAEAWSNMLEVAIEHVGPGKGIIVTIPVSNGGIYPFLEVVLRGAGFKTIRKFKNKNSGNWVKLLLRIT